MPKKILYIKLIPTLLQDSGESSDVSESEQDSEEEERGKGMDEEEEEEDVVRVLDLEPSSLTQALGEWERHTTVSA